LRLRERPLIVMDGSLLQYSRMTSAQAQDEIRRFWECCRKYRGHFVLLWHPHMLLLPRGAEFYENILAMLSA
jgi:lysophospholipid acyltransferase (LPLAT)-like uncharacterized protein